MGNDETVGGAGEDAAIAAIARVVGPHVLPRGWVGIGDDAAVTEVSTGLAALTTTDLLVEGVHFRRSTTPAWDLGWKAMAVNVSDIAGMGGVPRWATVSLALSPEVPLEWVEAFYRGARALCERYGLFIVGGDTVRSSDGVTIAVTVVGEAQRPLLRTTAEDGDAVIVTGPVGVSAAGLWALEHPERSEVLPFAAREALFAAHRRPDPQVEVGRALSALGDRIALMDNSDGLARSVLWLAGANGLHLELVAEAIPLSPETRSAASAAGVSPLDWGLYGGEDYNLVLTCSQASVSAVLEAIASSKSAGTVVGRCRAAEAGASLKDALGRIVRLEPRRTFQHFG
ncbi:MAG TPA: thiamine-phosphate kinase [Pantanalinema sp.]